MTIMEMVRNILPAKGLPKRLWAKAVYTVVYLLTRWCIHNLVIGHHSRCGTILNPMFNIIKYWITSLQWLAKVFRQDALFY